MANSIALAKAYTSLLDEVYKAASVTNDLTSDASLIRAGANANEILYPQIDVSGLGDYDRNSGYTDGNVSVVWKTATFNYDRGTKIAVDAMDDQETFGIAFGQASSELIRTKVAPEADAFTFATLAGITGISKATPATYADATQFLAALIEGKNKMDEDEVPEENRILYATPTLINGVMALDTTKSREVLNTFSAVKKVPQSRFYTAIDLQDGKSTGEEAGHYKKAASGLDINFVIVHKPCLMKWDKHRRQTSGTAQSVQDVAKLETLLREILNYLKSIDPVRFDDEAMRKYFIRQTNANTQANGYCELHT